jgi:hypothetical protein
MVVVLEVICLSIVYFASSGQVSQQLLARADSLELKEK